MPIFMQKMSVSLALLLIAMGAAQLLRARNSFERDYHWTPITARLPYDTGAKYFEVYLRDHRLQTALQAGKLGLQTEAGWSALTPSEVTIRINHIDRVTRKPLLLGTGFIAAALGWIAGLLFAGHLARQERTLAA